MQAPDLSLGLHPAGSRRRKVILHRNGILPVPDRTMPVCRCRGAIFVHRLRDAVGGHFGADCERQCLSRLAGALHFGVVCRVPDVRSVHNRHSAGAAAAGCASSFPSAGGIECCGAAPTSAGSTRSSDMGGVLSRPQGEAAAAIVVVAAAS